MRAVNAGRRAAWISALLLGLWILGAAGCRSSGSGQITGKGGSMARFALHGDHLYALGSERLVVFSLAQPSRPRPVGKVKVVTDAETLFVAGDRLYLGSQTGVSIFDLQAPERPRRLGTASHASACDPVVVRGQVAFVTLRRRPSCPGVLNELRVYDVSDPTRPRLARRFPMSGPAGIAFEGDRLYLADADGLKIFDARDPMELELIESLDDIEGFDLISLGDVLVVSARDGLYQLDTRFPASAILSWLPISRVTGH